jgi:hypothetical protein
MSKAPKVEPYVRMIESNVKSPTGDHWKLELGPRTLLVGSNTSHKTAAIQSIELALTGAADDIVGRSAVRDTALLMTLSPGSTLETTACLSDGTEAYFKASQDQNGKVSKPEHTTEVDCAGSLLLREVRQVMASGTDSARRSFLQWAGSELDETDIMAEIPTDLHAKYRDWAEHIRGFNPAHTLLNINDYVSKRQRDLAREAKGAKSVVSELREDIGDVRASAIKQTRYELDALLDRYARAQYRPDLLPEGWRHVDVAHETVAHTVNQELDTCLVCGTEVGNEHFHRVLDYYSDASEKVDRRKQHLISAELKGEFHQLLAKLTEQSQSTGQSTAAKNTMVKAIDLQTEAENYKNYKQQIADVIGRLLEKLIPNFCMRVNEFLPKGWFFGVQLKDGDKKVFRVGLQDDNRLRSALSGVEWATVTAAVGMAIGVSLPHNAPKIIIPEDRAWDAKTLSNVMRGFDNFDGQVIIASTIRPKGRPPKNWTIIDMDQWLEEQIEGQAEEVDAAIEELTSEPKPTVVVTRPADKGPERPVSSQGTSILQGLGFNSEQILRMSPDSAAEIIRNGWTISQVSFDADGRVQGRGV